MRFVVSLMPYAMAGKCSVVCFEACVSGALRRLSAARILRHTIIALLDHRQLFKLLS